MDRTPEPELMDDEEQARAYSEADFAEPHERFVTLLNERLAGEELSGDVLDLGCGPADVTARFARAFARCHVDGVDGAEAMLRFGRERLARAGLEDRVTLTKAYLPDEPPPRASYDALISNSLLHHLDDPRVLWESVRRYARPSAFVFVMDLMRPASREVAERFVEEYAAGEPEVLRRDFFHSLLAAYTVDEVRGQIEAAGLSGLVVEAVSDRHLIAFGRVTLGGEPARGAP